MRKINTGKSRETFSVRESCMSSKNNSEKIIAKATNLKTKVARYEKPIWSFRLLLFEIKKRAMQIKSEKMAWKI